jgi:hypothetical protein
VDELRVQRGRHQGLGLVRRGLEEIAEDGVVADFQRHAGLGGEAAFEGGDHPAAVVAQGAGVVEFRPDARGDETAVAHLGRQIGAEALGQGGEQA